MVASLNFYLLCVMVIFAWNYFLSFINRKYYLDEKNHIQAKHKLGLSDKYISESLAYFGDHYKFNSKVKIFSTVLYVGFLLLGGITLFENIAINIAGFFGSSSTVLVGVLFFALFILSSTFISLPISFYTNFVIEQKHGFNKQTKKLFFIDFFKNLIVSMMLFSVCVAGLVFIIENTYYWWLYGWLFMCLFTAALYFIYPNFISPWFNKFTPLPENDLKEELERVAKKADFPLDEIKTMDGSLRSTHGNAYFIGIFGKKKIVLYDTLVEKLSISQIAAVLAHELGHFKCKHVNRRLITNFISSGVVFFLLYLFVTSEAASVSFGFSEASSYSILFLALLWNTIIGAITNPIETYFIRKDEFEADRYAVKIYKGKELAEALKALSTISKNMPIVHPWFSGLKYSHPPLIERIDAIYQADKS